MKSQFKLAIYLSLSLLFIFLAMYYNQIDSILAFMNSVSEGGTYKLPTS